jgi:hypothetical protein
MQDLALSGTLTRAIVLKNERSKERAFFRTIVVILQVFAVFVKRILKKSQNYSCRRGGKPLRRER